jgi:hypothetical protein
MGGRTIQAEASLFNDDIAACHPCCSTDRRRYRCLQKWRSCRSTGAARCSTNTRAIARIRLAVVIGLRQRSAKQRYCLEQVLARNPTNAAVQRGLAHLPDVVARSPLAPVLPHYAAPGCTEHVARPGYTLCFLHWKAAKTEQAAATTPPPQTQLLLTASMLGEQLKLPSQRVNQLLAELGWISRKESG